MRVNEKLRQGFSIIINVKNSDVLSKTLIYYSRNSSYSHEILLYSNGVDFKTKRFIENSGYSYRVSNVELPEFAVYDDCLSLCSKEYVLLCNDKFIPLPQWDYSIIYGIENTNKDPEKGIFIPTAIGPSVKVEGLLLPLNYGDSPDTFRYNELCRDLFSILQKIKVNTKNNLPVLLHKDLFNRFLHQSIFSELSKIGMSPKLIEKTINLNLNEDEFPVYINNIKESVFYLLKPGVGQ